MNKIIYLDNASTTKPSAEAIAAMTSALECYGNPSSLHSLGLESEKIVEKSRSVIASKLGADKKKVYFTSGGTEANNTAIFGVARALKKRGNKIITSKIEHPSVLESFRALEKEGFTVVYLDVTPEGIIDMEQARHEIDEDTSLVSVMTVNNETGIIQPAKEIGKILHEKSEFGLFHTDAVQAFGKVPCGVRDTGADLISVSSHKIHGPKGVGVLYVKKGVTIKPLLTGGGQEKNMRSGTESVPLIYGLGGAIDSIGNINEKLKAQKELWSYAKNSLQSTGFVTINSTDDSLPYILNISVEGYRSETLLHFLEAQGIYVSSGSACAKGEGSYVLKEIGLSKNRIDSALRISFSRDNTKEDVDALKNALISATQKLRRSIK